MSGSKETIKLSVGQLVDVTDAIETKTTVDGETVRLTIPVGARSFVNGRKMLHFISPEEVKNCLLALDDEYELNPYPNTGSIAHLIVLDIVDLFKEKYDFAEDEQQWLRTLIETKLDDILF